MTRHGQQSARFCKQLGCVDVRNTHTTLRLSSNRLRQPLQQQSATHSFWTDSQNTLWDAHCARTTLPLQRSYAAASLCGALVGHLSLFRTASTLHHKTEFLDLLNSCILTTPHGEWLLLTTLWSGFRFSSALGYPPTWLLIAPQQHISVQAAHQRHS